MPAGRALESLVRWEETAQVFIIDKTWDLSLFDKSVSLKLDIKTDLEVDDTLYLSVVYGSEGPEFVTDTDDIEIGVITCSYDDAGWSIELPEIKQA